ncbi:MAG TPA: ABATE domain-containing protein [Terriglobia bacterium]|nr:ABATE domain-containing protein [Terriglobia bacterium]
MNAPLSATRKTAPESEGGGTRVPGHEFCGGRLALDFCNSYTPDRPAGDNDRLPDLGALVAWAHRAGWELPGVTPASLTGADLQVFRSLRLRLWNLFGAAIDGTAPDPADVDALDGAVLDAFSSLRLSPGKAGGPLVWRETAGPLDKLRHAIARDAADLLTAGELKRLKRCPGAQCGWLFYDTSKNASRRWCVMEDCGTRAKVRRFRARQRSEPAF